MSSPAPEGGRGRGNVFTRKIGPLPMWQWFLIALAMVGVYVIFQYRKNNQANANAANTAAGTSTGGTTGAGQVPQFVNQTNTYVAPPMAQPPPPSGHARGAPAPTPSPAQPLPSRAPVPTGESLVGSGYGVASGQMGSATVIGRDRATYTWASPQQAQAAVNAGRQLYLQPSPGVFTPAVAGGSFAQNTPLFLKN